jgi:hypothetical protein
VDAACDERGRGLLLLLLSSPSFFIHFFFLPPLPPSNTKLRGSKGGSIAREVVRGSGAPPTPPAAGSTPELGPFHR